MCLNGIVSVLIYYAVYGCGWAVIIRGSIFWAPLKLMSMLIANSVCVCVLACVYVCE